MLYEVITQLGAQRLEVLDDAVVREAHAPPRQMRVGVFLTGHAVRRPPGMGNAGGTVHALRTDSFRQLRDPPRRAHALERRFRAAVEDSHTGRVVAAVLQAPQPFEEDRYDVTPGRGASYNFV